MTNFKTGLLCPSQPSLARPCRVRQRPTDAVDSERGQRLRHDGDSAAGQLRSGSAVAISCPIVNSPLVEGDVVTAGSDTEDVDEVQGRGLADCVKK